VLPFSSIETAPRRNDRASLYQAPQKDREHRLRDRDEIKESSNHWDLDGMLWFGRCEIDRHDSAAVGQIAALAMTISVVAIGALVVAFASDESHVPDVQPPPPAAAGHPSDGWNVSVSVAPVGDGPLRFSVGPIMDAPNESKGWVEHSFTITNVGDVPIFLVDARTSVFLGPPPRGLLAADWGCGYESTSPSAPVHAGACLTYLDSHTLKPGRSLTRKISLFKGLRGMSPLTAGTYVFVQPVRYGCAVCLGGKYADLTLHVTYTISAADTSDSSGAPLVGSDLAQALGLELWPRQPFGCEFYVEVDDPAGYCLDEIGSSKLDRWVVAVELQGHIPSEAQKACFLASDTVGNMSNDSPDYQDAQQAFMDACQSASLEAP
jgi:hypothetical protein